MAHLIRSRNKFFCYSEEAGDPYRFIQLNATLPEILDSLEKNQFFDVPWMPIRMPSEASPVTDKLQVWLNFDDLRDYVVGRKGLDWIVSSFDSNDSGCFSTELGDSLEFPFTSWNLPSPESILVQRHGGVRFFRCGRNFMLWDQDSKRLARLNRFGKAADLDHPKDVTILSECVEKLVKVARLRQYGSNLFDSILGSEDFDFSEIKSPKAKLVDEVPEAHSGILSGICKPIGWHDVSRTLKLHEIMLSPSCYGLNQVEALLAHSDGENYLLRDDQDYFLWNSLGRYLDRIDEPKKLFDILLSLNNTTLLRVNPVRKKLDKNVAVNFGLQPYYHMTPYHWFDSWPSMNTELEDFPCVEYGLPPPEPILIAKNLCDLLVRSRESFHIWEIGTSYLDRISYPEQLPEILELLDNRSSLRIEHLDKEIPDEDVPLGWTNRHEDELLNFDSSAFCMTLRILLKNSGTYFVKDLERTASRKFLLWHSESKVLERINEPAGLFDILPKLENITTVETSRVEHWRPR